jgi:hypothetical protein
MIQSVAALTMNYTFMCVVILQSGRILPPYLEYKLRLDPFGFFDTQVNFNQSTWCHILPSAIFRLHIQRGMKRIIFFLNRKVCTLLTVRVAANFPVFW